MAPTPEEKELDERNKKTIQAVRRVAAKVRFSGAIDGGTAALAPAAAFSARCCRFTVALLHGRIRCC